MKTDVTQNNRNAIQPIGIKLPNGASVVETARGSTEDGDKMAVMSTNGNNDNNNNSNNNNNNNNNNKLTETTTAAEFCRQCPVCTTTLSDWSTTLNKIDADSALLSSLRKTSKDNKQTLSR